AGPYQLHPPRPVGAVQDRDPGPVWLTGRDADPQGGERPARHGRVDGLWHQVRGVGAGQGPQRPLLPVDQVDVELHPEPPARDVVDHVNEGAGRYQVGPIEYGRHALVPREERRLHPPDATCPPGVAVPQSRSRSPSVSSPDAVPLSERPCRYPRPCPPRTSPNNPTGLGGAG